MAFRKAFPIHQPVLGSETYRELALKEPWRGAGPIEGSGWHLYVIATDKLVEGYHLYKLSDLVRGLGLDIPLKARQHIKSGFLCLQQIPTAAIIERKDPNQVNEGGLTLCHK